MELVKVKTIVPGITAGSDVLPVGSIIELPEAAADMLVGENLAEFVDSDEDEGNPEPLNLEEMTLPQLRVIAEGKEIPFTAKTKKAELVAAIEAKLAEERPE